MSWNAIDDANDRARIEEEPAGAEEEGRQLRDRDSFSKAFRRRRIGF